MTPPIIEKKQSPVFTGSVGLECSSKKLGSDKIKLFGATAEGEVQHNGWRAGADVTVGTGFSVGAEIGKEFDIYKNWGLDLSANANYTRSLSTKNKASARIEARRDNGILAIKEDVAEWKPEITTAGVRAMANYTTNNEKFTFGVGVSGQYARNNAESNSVTLTVTDGPVQNTSSLAVNYHKEDFFVSPELKATWNANKHISLEANCNRFESGITAKYTF